jgi:N6-adenosine-specific RNA methylase IME4
LNSAPTTQLFEQAPCRAVQGTLEPLVGLGFRCVVADPPWQLNIGKTRTANGGAASEWKRPEYAERHDLQYPTMTVDQIAAMPVSGVAAKDAHLYVWTINAYVADTYAIARAWGFRPATLLTWCKAPMGLGLGGTFCNTAEFILFARRGTLKAERRVDTTWWGWPRGRHSEKPEAFQSLVESVSPGPRLELFARRARPGWTVWGNEVEANTTGEAALPAKGDA